MMYDRAQHDLLSWGAMVLPILVLWVFKWKPWSAVVGAVVHWGLAVCVLIVRNRFDSSGGAAGFYIILGGPFGFIYCMLLIAMRQFGVELFALVRRGARSPESGYTNVTMGYTGEEAVYSKGMRKQFYLKTGSGCFAKLVVNLNSDSSPNYESIIELTWWLNPKPGSRNLEFDPAKVVNPAP